MTENRVGGWREADRALLEAATPGPWKIGNGGDGRYFASGAAGYIGEVEWEYADDGTLAFIAAAPDIVRRALDALAAADALLWKLGKVTLVAYQDDEGIMRCPYCHHVSDDRRDECDDHEPDCVVLEWVAWDNERSALAASDTPEGR